MNDDFNNNKTILHECCSIPPASSQQEHVVINNGVKVVNSSDSINHSRTFIVKYIMEKLSNEERSNLLICNDFNGRTCLHYAAQMNRADLLDLLLVSFPTDHIDKLDKDSMSPLLLAIKHGHFNIIKNLSSLGLIRSLKQVKKHYNICQLIMHVNLVIIKLWSTFYPMKSLRI